MTGRYKHESRQFILRFEDMPGLEVVMRPVSVGKLLDLARMADEFKAGTLGGAQVTRLFETFAGRLVSWNLDVDGKEIPATLEGVESVDADLFMAIFEGWFGGMTSTPKEAGPPEADLPMTGM